MVSYRPVCPLTVARIERILSAAPAATWSATVDIGTTSR